LYLRIDRLFGEFPYYNIIPVSRNSKINVLKYIKFVRNAYIYILYTCMYIFMHIYIYRYQTTRECQSICSHWELMPYNIGNLCYNTYTFREKLIPKKIITESFFSIFIFILPLYSQSIQPTYLEYLGKLQIVAKCSCGRKTKQLSHYWAKSIKL